MHSMKGRETEAVKRATEVFPILGQRMSQVAGTLSGGEQQMLAIARAYVQSPRLVLVDEASLGLAPVVVDSIFEFLQQLARDGVALLIVDQFVTRALATASDGTSSAVARSPTPARRVRSSTATCSPSTSASRQQGRRRQRRADAQRAHHAPSNPASLNDRPGRRLGTTTSGCTSSPLLVGQPALESAKCVLGLRLTKMPLAVARIAPEEVRTSSPSMNHLACLRRSTHARASRGRSMGTGFTSARSAFRSRSLTMQERNVSEHLVQHAGSPAAVGHAGAAFVSSGQTIRTGRRHPRRGAPSRVRAGTHRSGGTPHRARHHRPSGAAAEVTTHSS